MADIWITILDSSVWVKGEKGQKAGVRVMGHGYLFTIE